MENRKVIVESLVKGPVGIKISDINLSRHWEKKGSKKAIPFEVLEEALYDQGVETMFKEGVLGVSEKDATDLGLIDEQRGEIGVVLDDFQRRRAMTVMPLEEFKTILEQISYTQLMELVDFSIENELTDIEKCSLIKEKTGRDIIRAVQLDMD